MCAGAAIAETWSSSQSPPENKFETNSQTPLRFATGRTVARADLRNVRWVSYCTDLVYLPVAAAFVNSRPDFLQLDSLRTTTLSRSCQSPFTSFKRPVNRRNETRKDICQCQACHSSRHSGGSF